MRRFTVIIVLILFVSALPSATSSQSPYLYLPTVYDTGFSVIAFYKTGDYGRVLEGCEWLLEIKSPLDSWGRTYGEKNEAKYTAVAIMALIRGESIARGRYVSTINNAVYWLVYKQNSTGAWEDYEGTALAIIALKEFLRSRYDDPNLPGLRKQAEDALNAAIGWLLSAKPKNDRERILGYLALGKKDELEEMKVSGYLAAYRAFALAYLGEKVHLEGHFQTPALNAMALYATGNQKYREALLESQHFGFWGVLRYRVLDIASVARIKGFEKLNNVACSYIKRIKPTYDWEEVYLAKYFVACGIKPDLPSNISHLLPWQIAEVARIKTALGENPSEEISELIRRGTEGWGDLYNTAYVVWVLRGLGVEYNYTPALNYMARNLTWILTTKDPKTGKLVADDVPTYYFAYALLVFKEFEREKDFQKTLDVLKKRQLSNGGWPYTTSSIAGLTTTSEVLYALQEANLTSLEMYKKGRDLLKKLFYADIPNLTEVPANSTALVIKGGQYTGNSTSKPSDVDGYVVLYPTNYTIAIKAVEVNGFRAENPWKDNDQKDTYVILVGIAVLGAGYVAWAGRRGKRAK